MGRSEMDVSDERNKIIARLPLRSNGALMSFIEARELFAAISTDAIRILAGLQGALLSDALTGMQYCEWDETILRDYSRLCHIDALKFTRVQRLTDHLKSLQFYDDLIPHQDDHYPEERASQAAAILTVVVHQKLHGINGWYLVGVEPEVDHYPYIDDSKLRELLLVSDYDRENLVDFIVERDIFDGEALSHLLEDSHSAITGGVL